MNNRTLKTIIYILVAFLIIGVILKILPYVILGGIVAYIAFKFYGFIKGKANKEEPKTNSYSETSSYTGSYKKEDIDTSEAIDVDFKEVK